MEKVRAVCGDACDDDRFDIIEQAKKSLLRNTNIKDSPEEMAVIDNILFRCWQMGWLKKYDDDIALMFLKLRNMAPKSNKDDIKDYIFDDRGDYIPNLYELDDEWHVTWIHKDDGDSIYDFTGGTPTEAVEKAYRFSKEVW